jgi:hypothetical protein
MKTKFSAEALEGGYTWKPQEADGCEVRLASALNRKPPSLIMRRGWEIYTGTKGRLRTCQGITAAPSMQRKFCQPRRCSRTKTTYSLCGLVVRVPGYRSRGPGSIPGTARFSEWQWVWNGVHSASWVQLRSYLKEKSSDSGLENGDYGRWGTAALTTRHPSIRRSWH